MLVAHGALSVSCSVQRLAPSKQVSFDMVSGRRRELLELLDLELVKLLLSYKKRFMLGLELWKARYGKLRPKFMNPEFWLTKKKRKAQCGS